MKLLKNLGKIVNIEIEIHLDHTNMNLIVFHLDILLLSESMNLLKNTEKKFVHRLKYAEHKVFEFV